MKNPHQHTPGPWKLEPHDDHFMLTDSQTGMSAIARVGLRASWDWDRRQLAKANAQLIAAAPELLEAAIRLMAMDEARFLDLPRKDAIAELGKARNQMAAAIAKATT